MFDFIEYLLALHLIIYDKLSPFEQLICKCASVIRDDIRRNVLSYIMNPSSNRLFAIGIQRLFELGVFGCASKGRQAVLEVNSVVEDSSIRHSQKLALALYCNCEKLSILGKRFSHISYKLNKLSMMCFS